MAELVLAAPGAPPAISMLDTRERLPWSGHGASHAIGHILGGTCDVPHGYCSCVMAPYVLAFNEPVNGDRQQRISAAFGQPGKRASDVVDAFIRGLGMPRRLSEVGVGEDRLQQVAEYTMMDLWARTNPRTIAGPDDVMQILRLAA
jgi:alcohol dehydrogenase class IV